MIHGCIDGFSRLITFLQCSNNNSADTVLRLFTAAVRKYRCPRRIRTDHGTENIRMAEWMLNYHGPDKKPVITGSSVHNQRIERLWVDVSSVVTSQYINLFSYMEGQLLLDPDNELHLYSLQYVFTPRINTALRIFVDQWNNHPLRTAGGKSPLQLWTRSLHDMVTHREGRNLLEQLSFFDQGSYGIDDQAPVPDIQTSNNVIVPRSTINVNDEQWRQLQLICDLSRAEDTLGIHSFMQVVQYLEREYEM